MNTLLYPRSISTVQLYIALLLIPFIYSTLAHYHNGYSINVDFHEEDEWLHSLNNNEDDGYDWMASLSDKTVLSHISIPGTSASMTNGSIGYGSLTQYMHLISQLSYGIRFIDVGCTRTDNNSPTFHIYYGRHYLHFTLDQVFEISISFLKRNPSETIIIRITQETNFESSDSFAKNMEIALQPFKSHIWELNSAPINNPILRQLRGKIVIARDFPGSKIGLDYRSAFTIQGSTYFYSNWDLYKKWSNVREHLYKAHNLVFTGLGPKRKSFINYLNGYGMSFPFFVASGHASAGNHAPRLATGLTTPGFEGWYPDFPRVECGVWCGGPCTIAFEGTNILTTDLINSSNFRYVGIIVADFPGPGLIRSIINVSKNFQVFYKRST